MSARGSDVGAAVTDGWLGAVETAADVLGEMLIALAEGEAGHTHEDIAAAVLTAGLTTLLSDEPAADRLDHVAAVLYGKLHDGADEAWGSLSEIERGFWLDLAGAAIRSADSALLATAGLAPGTPA